MSAPSFIFLPPEAFRRRRELSAGAWDLYVYYCSCRNRDTGQCNPSLKAAMTELQRAYHRVVHLRSELIEKGWIRMLDDRDAVELLVGEFPRPTVVKFAENSKQVAKNSNFQSEKLPKVATKVAENSNQSCQKQQLLDSPPYSEQGNEQIVAAATAAAADSEPVQEDPLGAVADEGFVEEVVGSGVYPETHVRHVWAKLKLHCASGGTTPVRRQFLHWLSTERAPAQPVLPGVGATVHELPANVRAKRCDVTCPRCFGSGMEIVAGKGARRCLGAAVEVHASPSEEVEALQREYEAARKELRCETG